MTRMQTRFDCFAPTMDWLNPLGSWDAAARWNTMAYDWITQGWRQWLELATIWPALENPASAANELARSVDAMDVPAALLADSASVVPTSPSVVHASRSVIPAQAGTQKARNARSVKAPASRLRGHDASARPGAADTKKTRRRPAKQKPRTRG